MANRQGTVTTGERRQCGLEGCQATFLVPKSATNKRFCSVEHRNKWHEERRQKAFVVLEEHPGLVDTAQVRRTQPGKPGEEKENKE